MWRKNKHKPKICDVEHGEQVRWQIYEPLLVRGTVIGCGKTSWVYTTGKATMINRFMGNMEYRRLVKILLTAGEKWLRENNFLETKKLTNYITPSITKKERFGPWIISIKIRRCHLSHLSYCWSSLSNKKKLYTWILWAVFSWHHYFLRRLKRILILSKIFMSAKTKHFLTLLSK